MTIQTINGGGLDPVLMKNYCRSLVNQFFKILPLWEDREPTRDVYMISLQHELLGCKGLLGDACTDPTLLSLVSILQYLIDNQDLDTAPVRREVFRAISLCNRMAARYAVEYESEVSSDGPVETV